MSGSIAGQPPQTYEERERRFGRYPGMIEPVDSLFRDREMGPREIKLGAIKYYPRRDEHPLPRDQIHWVIAWRLSTVDGQPLYRLLQIVSERAMWQDSRGRPMHRDVLTNWGAHTKTVSAQTDAHSLWITIGMLDHPRRQQLETIAANEPVQVPNGHWNCQDWIKSVLDKAVMERLLDPRAVDRAIGILSGEAALREWGLRQR